MQAFQLPQACTLSPLSLSHLCAKYLCAQFQYKLNQRSSQPISVAKAPQAPLMLLVPLISELDQIALTLTGHSDIYPETIQAVQINWDITHYADKLPMKPNNPGTQVSKQKEASLKRQYPLLEGTAAALTISRPCIVIDNQGMILAWHLPGILNDSWQGEMMAATEKLHLLLSKHQSSTSWHVDPEIFPSGLEGLQGVINISPAWFQQGHEVSTALRKPAVLDWLDCITQSNSILSAILAVIHPELYNAGQDTFKQLRECAEIQPQDVLHQWTSVFNGISVICNHLMLPHQDGNSRKQWLPGIGLLLEYGPGSVVGLLGGTLKHEVHNFEGERVCYAYFMRDRVHEWAGVPGNSWMNIAHYQ
ncbi:hypothetical protein H4582DRAFT_2063488 [Lactarius indigo]|nr:hypothetical protein H4582DRAFT_2063488 [Lactarius indigo]